MLLKKKILNLHQFETKPHHNSPRGRRDSCIEIHQFSVEFNMKRFIVYLCIIFLCNCQEKEREPKFFFGKKQQTVVAQRKVPALVTEFIPSSCIVVESTLPPCRHVRNLEIYPSVPTRITKTQIFQTEGQQLADTKPQLTQVVNHAPTPPLKTRPQQVQYSPPLWGWNFFNNIFRVQNVTYTQTKTEYITTRIQDPNTVVSFYIKGCRPSKLPFNLPECTKFEEVKKEEKNIVVMAPLKFIPDDTAITPTKSENVIKVEEVVQVEEEEQQQKEKDQKKAEKIN